jgi:hypothetical protein
MKVFDHFEACNFLCKFALIKVQLRKIWLVQIQVNTPMGQGCSPMFVFGCSISKVQIQVKLVEKPFTYVVFSMILQFDSKQKHIGEYKVISSAKWHVNIRSPKRLKLY